MFCEDCHENEATIHKLDLVDGTWVERHTCAPCALGGSDPTSLSSQFEALSGQPATPGKIIQFFGELLNKSGEAEPWTSGQCPGCGLAFEQFQQHRRLGCARCYDTFVKELEAVFLRVQECVTHRGKVPGRPHCAPPSPGELRRVRENLQRAIEEERFEDAALYRDKLRKMSDDSDADGA